jgi:hypothetical protein
MSGSRATGGPVTQILSPARACGSAHPAHAATERPGAFRQARVVRVLSRQAADRRRGFRLTFLTTSGQIYTCGTQTTVLPL